MEAWYGPKTSFQGKELTVVVKRNIIKMILRGGLGLSLEISKMSHGVRTTPLRIVPMSEWKQLETKYGGLKASLERTKALRGRCLISGGADPSSPDKLG
ncbi:hypothetical protein KFL_014660010 [Klebsormidium nitens]|uniref:Uncharacterized protein n=1 Tax=Klebsormidium nitens TaxID=105231 RepID=A0A1Y1IX73_KLENI|nr:hypothetical protein KFL_014660010 [Klebsormidium nitens]|eukprot:GAQ93357.1 hypothetical protein KFL_014660010 [Klebsormidium nitens]